MSSREAPREPFWTRCGGATPRDRSNLRKVMWTALGWAVVFVTASQALRRGLVPEGPASWTVAAVPILASILVVAAYARYLRQADELQRQIHLEAVALGFGGGFLGVTGWTVLERVGAPAADIGDATLFLALFYSIGIVRNTWRYR